MFFTFKNPFCLALLILAASCNAPQENTTETAPVSDETPTEAVSQLEKEHTLYRPGYADSVNAGLISEDTLVTSARRETSARVGDATVTVNYGSPGKRGRVLWNGLVSYDQIWVSGSHWATAVTFGEDVRVNGTEVSAGMYAFYTIPGREEWTLILNKNYDQHLADDYSKAEDVVRVNVPAENLDEVVQRLTYEVEETAPGQGELSLMWDQTKVSLPFEVVE
ncbi:MAG: DUF2911 domain-containing protein [Cyclobacteriaceae bacterium]